MLPAGFKPKVPTGERSQTKGLERSATGIGLRERRVLLKMEFGDEAFRRTVAFEQYKYWLEGGGPATEGDILKPRFQPSVGLFPFVTLEYISLFSVPCTLHNFSHLSRVR